MKLLGQFEVEVMKTTLDDRRNSTWRLFLTAHVRVVAQIEAKLAAAKLPPIEWYDVVFALKEMPDRRLRLSELADRLLLSRSNLTRLVDRLEKEGLLYREACPDDRRGMFAVLTAAGLTLQQQMWEVYAAGIAEYFGDALDDAEVEVMQQAMRKVLAALS